MITTTIQPFQHWQPGNWMLYLPEGQLCTIEQIGPHYLVERFNGPLNAPENMLVPVKLQPQYLRLAGFIGANPHFEKELSTNQRLILHTIAQGEYKMEYRGEIRGPIKFVHELQNACAALTGEILSINLIGD